MKRKQHHPEQIIKKLREGPARPAQRPAGTDRDRGAGGGSVPGPRFKRDRGVNGEFRLTVDA